MRLHLALRVLGGVTAWTTPAVAQEAGERPEIRSHRYDEDWRDWCARQPPGGVDRVKCIRAGDALLSLGGEWRERVEVDANPGFGLDGDDDTRVLHRLMLHADLRVGHALRGFVQFGYLAQDGRRGGAAPTDLDRGDLLQGFVDVIQPLGPGDATLRVGRQEITLGSSRLVSVREAPNARRSFDGMRLIWQTDRLRVDALAVRPVTITPGTFEDPTDRSQQLWGVQLSGAVAADARIEAYLLGFGDDHAQFAQGRGRERRQSLGLRTAGTAGAIDWDVEAVAQFGDFGSGSIRAWTIASDNGLTLSLPAVPRLGLKADIASGDDNLRDARLQTFNALFPKFPYFSEANVIAPANVMDLHPQVTVQPVRGLTVEAGVDWLWRHRVADAIYAAPLIAYAGTAGQPGRFIGRQFILDAEFEPSRHAVIRGQFVRFVPGDALRDVGGRAGSFLTLSIATRF